MWGNFKQWFLGAFDLVKQHKLETAFIAIGIVLVLSIIISVLVSVFSKKDLTPQYSKEDFVHKVLKYDLGVTYQILFLVEIGVLIAGLVCFFTKATVASFVLLCILVAALLISIILKCRVRFCRVEYNNVEVYKIRFMKKPLVLEWKEIEKVLSGGFGKNRYLVLVGKNHKKIKVSLGMAGGYEFSVFCEKQFEGKNFEAVKITKARQ